MEWFEFLLSLSSSVEPYITLILFSVWLSYLAKKENHILSRVSFLETDLGFLLVIVIVILYKLDFVTTITYDIYVFFSAVGVMWGILGLIWGLVFYFVPIEKILKIRPKKKIIKEFKYPKPVV